MVATPAPDANDVGEWVRIAVLLVRLLLVYLGDDLVHRAPRGTRWRRGLRKHPCAENNHGYCPSDVHTAIISGGGPAFRAVCVRLGIRFTIPHPLSMRETTRDGGLNKGGRVGHQLKFVFWGL